MIFLILLAWIFFPITAFAAPQVLITNFPDTVSLGDSFPVTFSVSSAEIGTTYHYKIVGDTATDISIFPSCTSRYDDCSNLIISDTNTNIAVAYAKINVNSSLNKIKIRIAQSDKHSVTFDSPYVNIVSFLPTPVPVAEITPVDTPKPTTVVLPTLVATPLILSEIMANPETDQNEWIEIFNPGVNTISLKGICFYDASNHSRCFSDDESIGATSYYSSSFPSGFLNNDGDTITFLDSSITYPRSPKNFSYSRQVNNSWCFSSSSQNNINNECTTTNEISEANFSPPQLTLQFTPDSVVAGEEFNLVFSLKTEEAYSLRLISPFGSSYFPFSDYKDGYSWLTIPLSAPKKTPEGTYPLSFHLKKAGSSHLYDYQFGNLNVKPASIISKKSKVLGASTYTCPQCVNNSATVNYLPASTLKQVSPDYNFFSWPFFFVGSILFLSPILFPKLYSV